MQFDLLKGKNCADSSLAKNKWVARTFIKLMADSLLIAVFIWYLLIEFERKARVFENNSIVRH